MTTTKPTPNSIRVMLVEDSPDYSDIVKLALECEVDIELTDRFGTSEAALRSLKDSDAVSPDVILLDLRLPGLDGLDSLPQFTECAPQSKVVVLTQSDQQRDVLQAIQSGAAGYLLKSATVQQLVDGIRTVASGGAPLDANIARYILESLKTPDKEPDGDTGDSISPVLSKREFEVLTLLANGLVKKEIAAQLSIGYTTVDTHVGRIYGKLNVNNAPAAIHEAHRRRILPTDDG